MQTNAHCLPSKPQASKASKDSAESQGDLIKLIQARHIGQPSFLDLHLVRQEMHLYTLPISLKTLFFRICAIKIGNENDWGVPFP